MRVPIRVARAAERARASGDRPLIDDVIAAIDAERLTGDQFGAVHAEKRDRNTHVIDGDQAAQGPSTGLCAEAHRKL